MYRVIGADQKIYGPASVDQVRQWLADGRLSANSLAQPEGATDWKPLSMFPEFIPPPVITPPPHPPQPVRDDATGLATLGLVLGVAANVCCCFGVIFAIAGLIVSIIALQRMEGHPQHSGRAMAWAGIGLSIFGLIPKFFFPFWGFPHPFWFRRFYRL